MTGMEILLTGYDQVEVHCVDEVRREMEMAALKMLST